MKEDAPQRQYPLRELARLASGRSARPQPSSLTIAPCSPRWKAAAGRVTTLQAAPAAEAQGIRLEVVKLQEAKKGFVLLPRRWVVERSFGWAARFKRLSRDYERLASTLAGLHWLAFATLLLAFLFPKS